MRNQGEKIDLEDVYRWFGRVVVVEGQSYDGSSRRGEACDLYWERLGSTIGESV